MSLFRGIDDFFEYAVNMAGIDGVNRSVKTHTFDNSAPLNDSWLIKQVEGGIGAKIRNVAGLNGPGGKRTDIDDSGELRSIEDLLNEAETGKSVANKLTSREIHDKHGGRRRQIGDILKNYDEANQNLSKRLTTATGDERTQIMGAMRENRDGMQSLQGMKMRTYADETMAYGKRYWNWMWEGDRKQQAIKVGGTIGASVVAGTAGRMVTGGSITENNKGERDIAGIPFL